MFAIVEIAGQQIKVEKDQKLFVNKLDATEGAALHFDRVMLTADGSSIAIGAPTLSGVTVTATLLSHHKGDTIRVFKKKRRKGYRKTIGHRQHFSRIQIVSIG